jgi:hypothetical protein
MPFIHAYLLPPAYVSRVHYETLYVIPACTEIPHPDDEYISVLVNSITGGPNEFSHVPQVNFTTANVTPWGEPEFALDFTQRRRVQTRALGQTHHSPSKMRGRN